MTDNIQVIGKPDWVSWDDIKQCLVEAHSVNRAKGVNMSHPLWPAEKIKESIGENGVVLVALDGDKLIGTAAISDKTGGVWYAEGSYAYLCFDAVIPEYAGKGVFKLLDRKREQIARERGYNILLFDTHINNKHRQRIAQINGYRLVRFFRVASKDHYNVIMVKWLDGSPYSDFYCRWKYWASKTKTLFLTKVIHR